MDIYHGTCPLGYKRDETKKVIIDETTKDIIPKLLLSKVTNGCSKIIFGLAYIVNVTCKEGSVGGSWMFNVHVPWLVTLLVVILMLLLCGK